MPIGPVLTWPDRAMKEIARRAKDLEKRSPKLVATSQGAGSFSKTQKDQPVPSPKPRVKTPSGNFPEVSRWNLVASVVSKTRRNRVQSCPKEKEKIPNEQGFESIMSGPNARGPATARKSQAETFQMPKTKSSCGQLIEEKSGTQGVRNPKSMQRIQIEQR